MDRVFGPPKWRVSVYTYDLLWGYRTVVFSKKVRTRFGRSLLVGYFMAGTWNCPYCYVDEEEL